MYNDYSDWKKYGSIHHEISRMSIADGKLPTIKRVQAECRCSYSVAKGCLELWKSNYSYMSGRY